MCIMKLNTAVVDREELTGAEGRLLSAVPAYLRNRVRAALSNPRIGGRGLRAWLAMIENDDRPLPDALSGDLVKVYLSDTEAEPLYDCEECGLPVPVRAGRRGGHEPSCDRVYFA